MFVLTLTIMSIMMTVAVQTVSFQMQREREAELIFRGEQYVEAIRLYKNRFGRYPMRLKEIWDAKPRVIRKKWKDPITDSEQWGIIFLGQGQGRDLTRPGTGGAGGGGPQATPSPQPGWSPDGGEEAGGPDAFGGPGEGERVGPIIGVHSRSCEDSIKVHEGRTRYCDWQFVYKETQRRGGGGNPPPGGGG
jgi:type II secretory pathway pseudopilin PulG